MANSGSDAEWMRLALDLLYSELSRDQAMTLLQDGPGRNELLNSMRTSFEALQPPMQVPDGDVADNLLQALIAIRTKFEQEEGRAKVEMNIAMRNRRR